MANKFFINYGSNGFEQSQKKGLDSAKQHDFITVGYRDSDISETFLTDNKKIFSYRRGGGYWLWKPYIILDMLNKIEYGDVLVYMDAGANFISNPSKYINDIPEDGIFGFSMIQKSSKWTKGDCFYVLNINENDKYKFSQQNQIQATYIFMRKTDFVLNFVKEWLNYCTDENLLTDVNNIYCNNLEDFIEHRHDQAIFSLMCYKYNIKIIPQIDQYCTEHGLSIDRQVVYKHGMRI